MGAINGAPTSRHEHAAVADLDRIETLRDVVAATRLADEVVGYIVDLVRATREHPALACGASPRSAAM